MNTPAPVIPLHLPSHAHASLVANLERLRDTAIAISALGKILAASQMIKEADPCENCADLHLDLTNPAYTGSLHTAIDELGDVIVYLAEQSSELLVEAATRRNQI